MLLLNPDDLFLRKPASLHRPSPSSETDPNLKPGSIQGERSHGTYYDETPSPEDLKPACEETISVVEYFAVGQLKLIRKTE
jgi:hypothetical protein